MKFFVFSPTLETLGIVSNYNFMTHTQQFAGSGTFKLKAPFTEKLFAILAEENILYWEDSGKKNAVFIETVICENDEGGTYITASGKNIRAYLGRRIVWKNIHFTGTAEDFARQMVEANAINPTDVFRELPLLSLAPRKGLTPTITTLTENENLEALLDNITATTDVGFDITLDKTTRSLSFVAFEGTDRRTTQTATPWLIVSRDRNNVVSESYTRSGVAFRNSALVSGYTDDDTGTRFEVEINAGEGLSRREIYVSGRASKPRPDEGIGETEAQATARYRAELLQKGLESLAKQIMVESLEVEPNSSLIEKLNVGDKITALERQYNLELQTFVSEITLYYGHEGRRIDITLGDAIPTIYEKLRKDIE